MFWRQHQFLIKHSSKVSSGFVKTVFPTLITVFPIENSAVRNDVENYIRNYVRNHVENYVVTDVKNYIGNYIKNWNTKQRSFQNLFLKFINNLLAPSPQVASGFLNSLSVYRI